MEEFNLKSSTLEKGLDLAKGFLGKLLGPGVEEVGLLLKDKIQYYRFTNQVRMLEKANLYVQLKKIDPKKISTKILVPLLENASLEDDEELLERWAILLGNMSDSKQNVNNHVFPFILSQLSIQEFNAIKLAYDEKNRREQELLTSIENWKMEKDVSIASAKLEREQYEKEHNTYKEGFQDFQTFTNKVYELERRETNLQNELLANSFFITQKLKGYEQANLIRLGVVRTVIHNEAILHGTPSLGIVVKGTPFGGSRVQIDQTNTDALTELGVMLIEACTEKK